MNEHVVWVLEGFSRVDESLVERVELPYWPAAEQPPAGLLPVEGELLERLAASAGHRVRADLDYLVGAEQAGSNLG
ncbi:hypothetical protein [Crossiella sp. NPDC003009]